MSGHKMSGFKMSGHKMLGLNMLGNKMSGNKMSGDKMSGHKMSELESALGQLKGAKGAGGHQEADIECPGSITGGQGARMSPGGR